MTTSITILRKQILWLSLFLLSSGSLFSAHYSHFKVCLYARAYEVEKMGDAEWLQKSWDTISSQLDVDKIYLETHRDLLIVEGEVLEQAKSFFESKGVEVAGGITYTIDESNLFETYCYSNPEHLAKAREVIEHSARHFDEVILDDFFFTSCKCELCIEAKGARTWTDYRLELLNTAAKKWILEPAKKANSNVSVIIKYPNWYEHFQGLGFDLQRGPSLFDGIYTGTETRDAVLSNQHLQPYHGFLISRYFTHLAPGRNGGGWVDPFASTTLDRYGEQFWMTLLAKAPEMTLFDYRMMLAPLDQLHQAPWQSEESAWDYGKMLSYHTDRVETAAEPETIARAAGFALSQIDADMGDLGEPLAIPSYKPFHSTGEDFLQSFIGMIGIPVRLVSQFPDDAEVVLLTASAAHDPEIIDKIESQLRAGKQVVVTSGLLREIQDTGFNSIVELSISERKALGKDFMIHRQLIEGEDPMLFSQLEYLTNDSWAAIEVMDGGMGWPIFHFASYAEGTLWVWVVPDNFSDLYRLPHQVLNMIRERIAGSLGVWMEGPGKVSLFLYDNQTIVVHSFSDQTETIRLISENTAMQVKDGKTGVRLNSEIRPEKQLRGGRKQASRLSVELTLPAHSYRVLKW